MGRRRGVLLLALAVATGAPSAASAATAAGAYARGASRCAAIGGVPASADALVDVRAPSVRSTRAAVFLDRRRGTCWVAVAGPFGAWVGANGLSAHHVEGDLTTPLGVFGFEPVIYGIDPNPGLTGPYHRLVCGDWWDEAPVSPQYNQFVHVACGTVPRFANGSEALWREAPAYDAFAVVAYNTAPRLAGRGSGIFVHESTGNPTAGCVSLEWGNLLTVLRFITSGPRAAISIRVTG